MGKKDILKNRLVGTWFNLFFMRGWSRIGFIINWGLTVSGWIGTIALLLNYHPRSLFGWAWLVFCMIVLSVIVMAVVAWYGRWDIGKSGTRITEQMKDFEKNAPTLILANAYFMFWKTMAEAQGIKIPKEAEATAEWVKECKEKLGV